MQLDIQRTEPPYGHCVKDGDDPGGFNMYADYYGVGYTDKVSCNNKKNTSFLPLPLAYLLLLCLLCSPLRLLNPISSGNVLVLQPCPKTCISSVGVLVLVLLSCLKACISSGNVLV